MKSKPPENQTEIQQNNSKVTNLSDLNELTNQEAEMVIGGWEIGSGGSGGSGSGGSGGGGGTWCLVLLT